MCLLLLSPAAISLLCDFDLAWKLSNCLADRELVVDTGLQLLDSLKIFKEFFSTKVKSTLTFSVKVKSTLTFSVKVYTFELYIVLKRTKAFSLKNLKS